MADEVRITNMPESGTREAIALSLAKLILAAEASGGNTKSAYTKDKVLSTYASAFQAVKTGTYKSDTT